ncbi:hypothetical protein [Maricaulis maris]|uniref:Uncharacterized protein n=1 Tax=Maricaulis maris TaxID=74318 RepID=A0A495DQB1_9PROT|nr:hypothetical protein [Maricaulis maris]RKR04159.1 hypothetical protein C7435_0603 [Maricaulis maris]
MTSQTPRIFWLAFGLIILEAGYALFNAGKDLIIRFLPGSHAYMNPAEVAFILSVSWLQELVFFSAVAATCVSVYLMLQRSIWVLATYAAGVFLTKADWLISGFNGVELFALNGYVSLIYQTVVMGVLVWLSFLGKLD